MWLWGLFPFDVCLLRVSLSRQFWLKRQRLAEQLVRAVHQSIWTQFWEFHVAWRSHWGWLQGRRSLEFQTVAPRGRYCKRRLRVLAVPKTKAVLARMTAVRDPWNRAVWSAEGRSARTLLVASDTREFPLCVRRSPRVCRWTVFLLVRRRADVRRRREA